MLSLQVDLRLPTPQHSHKHFKSDDFSASTESADVLRTQVRTHRMAGRGLKVEGKRAGEDTDDEARGSSKDVRARSSDRNFDVERWERVGDEREEWQPVRDSSTSLIVQQANSQLIALMERALRGPSPLEGRARTPLGRHLQGCIEEPHLTLEVIYISYPSQMLR